MTLVLSITSISSTSIIYADDFSDEIEVMTEDEGAEEADITDDSEIDFDSEEDISINGDQIEDEEPEESQGEVTIEQEIPEEDESEVSFDDGVEESDVEAAGDSTQNTYGNFGYEEYNGGIRITDYTGTEDSVSVPAEINGKKVIVIAPEVFAWHNELKSITLPEGLESIGYRFIAGTRITSLTVPSTVTECDNNYGRHGITEGSSLETLIFADGTKTIPRCFCYKGDYGSYNYTLQHIEIPESVTEIGEKAFDGCAALEEIEIGKEISRVGNSAFQDCTGLKKVSFQKNDKTVITNVGKKLYPVTIGKQAFTNCAALTEVNLSVNINTIEPMAFSGCKELKELNLPEGLENIGYGFIANTGVISLTVPSTVIGGDNNYGREGIMEGSVLETLIFADGIKTIPGYFCYKGDYGSDNYTLQHIEIPESVTEIGEKAFDGCAALEEIEIGKEISRVGNSAFQECTGLKKVSFQKNDKMVITNAGKKLYPVTIGKQAFTNCAALTEVNLSVNINTIEPMAFSGCKELKELNLPEGLENIGYGFIANTGVISLTVPSTVIGGDNNYGREGIMEGSVLETLIFADGIKTIPGYFCYKGDYGSDNYTLQHIEIPESVTEIGEKAFDGCAALEEIEIGKEISRVGNSAFQECTGLKKVSFQKNDKMVITNAGKKLYPVTIGRQAFAGCTALTEVNLSVNVNTIEPMAFSWCKELKELNLPEGLESIGYDFIAGTEITSLIVPSTVTGCDSNYGRYGIMDGASYLEKIEFADTMKAIPDYFFKYYNNENNPLKVIIPESVTSIGDNTFYNCKNITIYGYTGSYAETYAVAHNIPFESLGDVIGSHEYDYSSTLDQWLLDKGTSNSMNYLIRGDNFLCTQSVAYYDSSNSEKLVETMSNMIYRGLDGWRDIFIKDTTKEQARDVLLALLKEQESEVSALADLEARQKYSSLFIDTFKNANWAFAVNYGLNNEEINSLAKLCTKDQIAEFLKSGKDVTISAYLQMKGGYSSDSKVVKCIESFAESKTFINKVVQSADFISDATKVLSLGEKTINNYYDIQRLLNADKMYEEMLLFIANDTGSVPVKNAAQELYNALHGGWYELTNLLAGDIENEVANKVYDELVGEVISALPYGEIIKTSLHYSVDLSNLLFKTDDIQKQKDNMRCVAYIGSSISRWLINTRMEYLTGADSTKAENAKKTVYAYYMLLKTRMAGEESLQKMMEIARTSWKEAYGVSKGISETLKSNLQWMKDSGVLKEMSTSVVACPVDVEIYDVSGNLVHTMKDGVEESGTIGNIYYSVAHEPVKDDYIKIVRIPVNRGYSLKCKAVDLGMVDFYTSTISDDGSEVQKSVFNIPVQKGNEIQISGISEEKTKCELIKDDKVVKEYEGQTSSEQYIPVTSIQINKKDLSLKEGERELIDFNILPSNATVSQINWISSDESVAAVSADGIISAKKAGKAVIKGVADKENDITAEVSVTVLSTDKDDQPGKDDNTTIECKHSWSKWKTLNKATVFKGETQTRTCSKCKKTEKRTLNNKVKPVIALNTTSVTLKVRQSTTGLKITKMANGDSVASWKSSNTKVVKVSGNGKLTAQKKTGKAIVTVKLKSGIEKKITVKVQKGNVKTIKITGIGKNATLKMKQKMTLKPVRLPFTSMEKITFKSSNNKIATVNSKGVITAKKKGKATITVKAGNKTAKIKVTVK